MAALALLAFLFSPPVVAQASPSCFRFITNNGAITITGYIASFTCMDPQISIPSAVNDLPVTAIASRAFQNQTGLTSIAIPDSVTSIGDYVFVDCIRLTAITVDPNNPNFSSVGGVLFDNSQTTLIEFPRGLGGGYAIPNSVTTIGDSAFHGSSLTSVTIPYGVTSIGNGAFGGCQSLTSIAIPQGVSSIGYEAFADCYGLSSVCFAGSPPADGGSIFANDAELTAIYYVLGTSGWGLVYDGIAADPCGECGAVTATRFTASPVIGATPLAVQFYCPSRDSFGNTIESWNWVFGDGGTSTAQNPSHTDKSVA